ncbi:MAG: protein kinase, partial [Prevotellaceae bacterium]|nr:protein kinase [Prevotellaceae bacterium]
RHPNIVKVLESFEANGTVYYSMEYIGGGSLDDLILSRGRLSERKTVRLAREICSGLQFMHEHRMLHLDLKPHNIMVRNGHAVLIGFGLSKRYDVSEAPESSSIVGRGTKGYAPLEQNDYQEGNGIPVTIDIYALGGTVFKMLAGHRPPDASHILNQGFPAADLQGVGVSPWLVELIRECMAPPMMNRPQSASEVLNVLRSKNPQDVIMEELVCPPNSDETVFGKTVAPKPAIGFINGHEWVDLGLSVKWATCNVGARSPFYYADHFAWGETKTKPEYGDWNSATVDEENMPDIAGNPKYDAACANWGGSWRLPTASEIDELIEKCQHTWTTVGDIDGCKVTGPNGNSIFLPAEGSYEDELLLDDGYVGHYWTSTPYECYTERAYGFSFDSAIIEQDWEARSIGRSVRPVTD